MISHSFARPENSPGLAVLLLRMHICISVLYVVNLEQWKKHHCEWSGGLEDHLSQAPKHPLLYILYSAEVPILYANNFGVNSCIITSSNIWKLYETLTSPNKWLSSKLADLRLHGGFVGHLCWMSGSVQDIHMLCEQNGNNISKLSHYKESCDSKEIPPNLINLSIVLGG